MNVLNIWEFEFRYCLEIRNSDLGFENRRFLYGMPERAKSKRLRLYISRLWEKGDVLWVYKLSPVKQATARLLLPHRRWKNLRPQLPRLRQGLAIVRKLKIKKQNAKLRNRSAGYFNSLLGSAQNDKLLLMLLLRNTAHKKGRAKITRPLCSHYYIFYFEIPFSSSASFPEVTVSVCKSPKMTRYSLSETFHRIRTLSASLGVTVLP